MLKPEDRLQLETALLATTFLGPTARQITPDLLSAQGQRILRAVLDGLDDHGRADVQLVGVNLRQNNGTAGADLKYLADVLIAEVRGLNAGHYMRRLALDHGRREAVAACKAAAEAIAEGDSEARFVEHLEAAQAAIRGKERTLPEALDLVSILAEDRPEPVPWAIEGLFAEGDLLVIAGEGGAGKSILSLDLALALSTGQHFLGLQCARSGPVLYLDRENQLAEVRRRIGQHCRGRGISTPPPLHYCMHPDLDLSPDGIHRIAELIDETGAAWVALDAWIRFSGAAEGDNVETASVTARMRQERARSGVGWIVLAHLAKPSKERPDPVHRVRGASDLVNSSDALLSLAGDRHSDTRTLTPEQRRTATLPAMQIAWRTSEDESAAELVSLGSESSSAERVIRRLLEISTPHPVRRADLVDAAEEHGHSPRAASRALARMVATGEIQSDGGKGRAGAKYLLT